MDVLYVSVSNSINTASTSSLGDFLFQSPSFKTANENRKQLSDDSAKFITKQIPSVHVVLGYLIGPGLLCMFYFSEKVMEFDIPKFPASMSLMAINTWQTSNCQEFGSYGRCEY